MVAYVARHADLVYDPATGRGAFLEALREIAGPDKPFYGTDVDPDVLKDDLYRGNNCRVEKRDFIRTPPQGKFKAIVANPPYIRHHRLDQGTKAFLRLLCQNITGFTIDGRAGYHVYFLLQGLAHLAEDGRLAYIMPADTCEGVFSRRLWQWIAGNFCIDGVVVFGKEAAPFPLLDTNAMIFFIRKSQPSTKLSWIRIDSDQNDDLTKFVESDFKERSGTSLYVNMRDMKEALETGFSRPECRPSAPTLTLSNFAHVKRGIATGSNEFFLLTADQVSRTKIPSKHLRLALGKTRHVKGDTITPSDIAQLIASNNPLYLLALKPDQDYPMEILNYLKKGEEMLLPNRPLIRQRKPWYKMEERAVPPILFAYLGRRNLRFIKNEAGVLPLTGFLCVYPFNTDKEHVDALWRVLNHPATIANLALVGKSYGSQAIKVEPRNLEKLPIPDYLIREYGLASGHKKMAQLSLLG